ncbi:MAG: diguanylate cyclase [Gammaproteobacteria bacterium]|nr:diguanylate cyclase [Gammaproteobacteria bacterium]
MVRMLKSRLRERDTLARLGGDEFAVLLGECSVDQALRIANELREVILAMSWGLSLSRNPWNHRLPRRCYGRSA